MDGYSRLGTNLDGNTTMGRLGVIDGFGTGLDILADTVVVAGREGLEVVQAMQGDGVIRSVKADSGSVLGDVALSNVVGSLTTEEEAVATNDGISGESGALTK